MDSRSAVLNSPSVQRVREALQRRAAGSRRLPAEASDEPVLVMYSGARRVDTERLARLLSQPVAKAGADYVRQHVGFVIGNVAPGGHSVRRVFVDARVRECEPLCAAAGHFAA